MKRYNNAHLFGFLHEQSPKLLWTAIFLGIIAGALYGFVIPVTLSEIANKTTNSNLALFDKANRELVFFLICIAILLAKAVSVILINNTAKSATAELRIKISHKINESSLKKVEDIGFSKLIVLLIEDVNNVSAAALAIPMVLISIVTVVGMLGYLCVLNVSIFFMVVVSIVFGVILFKIPVAMASGLYNRARDLRDSLQESIRGLVLGAYELKLGKKKSETYIREEISTPQIKVASLEKLGDAIFHAAGTSSDLLSFFIIGFVVFYLPDHLHYPAADNYGVVMVLLYIAGPITNILGTLQHLNMGQISLNRIMALGSLDNDLPVENNNNRIGRWKEFRLDSVSYHYPNSGSDSFSLSPVSILFKPGEITFIVGGNGSGKSTLAKIISLHYSPSAGNLYFDNVMVDPNNIFSVRERISVIFSNYYIFEKFYRELTNIERSKLDYYLSMLKLDGKTQFINNRFTTTKLSDGQRRRLALLIALLDDKEIYVFDEWASDQDPEFKTFFYQEILPDMKRLGKLVIVITHDDRYFHCADRVIFMEDGKLTGIKSNVEAQINELVE